MAVKVFGYEVKENTPTSLEVEKGDDFTYTFVKFLVDVTRTRKEEK